MCLVSKQDKERLCALFVGDQQSGITRGVTIPTQGWQPKSFPSDASTSAKQRTSPSASDTSFGGGRKEAKNLRLKDSTLGRENARVLPKSKQLCSIVIFQTNHAGTLHQARLHALSLTLDMTKLTAPTLCCTPCSMLRACSHKRSAAIVSQTLLVRRRKRVEQLDMLCHGPLLQNLRRMRSAS